MQLLSIFEGASWYIMMNDCMVWDEEETGEGGYLISATVCSFCRDLYDIFA